MSHDEPRVRSSAKKTKPYPLKLEVTLTAADEARVAEMRVALVRLALTYLEAARGRGAAG